MDSSDVKSRIILPSSAQYDEARQVYNRSIQKCPAAIVYCENVEEVSGTIAFAHKRGYAVNIRSGGHSYEGYCVGNGTIVVDVSAIKYRQIDTKHNTVRIGGGINNRELYGALARYGYPFPSGTCPRVGASGITQGGGWGHSARMLGLTCDWLLEADIIDANGRLLMVSRRHHSDLFWALRGGGGGNFGAVVSLKFSLPSRVKSVAYVDIQYPDADKQTMELFFLAWQTWLETADNRFTPNSRLYQSDSGTGIYLRGFYYGTEEEAEQAVAPFLAIEGAQPSIRTVSFYEATQIDASVYPSSELFRFAGRFAYENFTEEQIEGIISAIGQRAEGSTFASVALYAMGGRVKSIGPNDTAFFHRGAKFIIGFETVWEDPCSEEQNLVWLQPRFEYLQSITRGSYVNFPYLETDSYMQAYYGDNSEALSRIKRRYDPDNVFRFPQSIPPL